MLRIYFPLRNVENDFKQHNKENILKKAIENGRILLVSVAQ
jgi:hypothetical protein